MPLINYEVHLELNWIKSRLMPNIVGETTFKITNTKLYLPTVTLSIKDNIKPTK